MMEQRKRDCRARGAWCTNLDEDDRCEESARLATATDVWQRGEEEGQERAEGCTAGVDGSKLKCSAAVDELEVLRCVIIGASTRALIERRRSTAEIGRAHV